MLDGVRLLLDESDETVSISLHQDELEAALPLLLPSNTLSLVMEWKLPTMQGGNKGGDAGVFRTILWKSNAATGCDNWG